jgi:acetyl-CoA acetyltransferase
VVPVTDWLGQTILEEDEFIKPRTTLEGLASLKPAFEQMGAMGFDAVALALPAGRAHPARAPRPATRRASSTAPRGADRQRGGRARRTTSSRARASSPPRCRAPTRPSC